MKIEELSVGDWVNIYHRGVKTSYRIKRIFPSEYDGVYMIRTHTNWDVNINGLMPIPITAEILEKNGFRPNEHSDKIYEYNDFNCLMQYFFVNHKLCIRNNNAIDVEINSVHQLQQALRLAGVEKEVVL